VRLLGPSRVGAGASPRWRGRETGAAEPSLERADGRHRAIGESVAQPHADQARPPGRVLAAQIQGRLHKPIGGLGRGRPAAVVGGGQEGRVATTEAVEQMPDRARRQVEGTGDGGAILAGLVAPPDGLAQGRGEWARHGPFSIKDAGQATGPQCIPVPIARQNFVSQFRGETLCRVTGSVPRSSDYAQDATDRCAETINYLHTQFGLLKERVDKVWLLP
jgi:hypothetical protein